MEIRNLLGQARSRFRLIAAGVFALLARRHGNLPSSDSIVVG